MSELEMMKLWSPWDSLTAEEAAELSAELAPEQEEEKEEE